MPGSYRAQGIVLRRTKLGETDLIVTLLCDRALQVRAVAKGARKPGSRLAGVVDLGNEVSLLLHQGRNLDTVGEGRLVTSRAALAFDIERSAMAAALLDCAAELTAEGEHDERLYPLTSVALDAVAAASIERLGLVGAAYLFKAAAMQGYRPVLDACVCCGERIDLAATAGVPLFFSFAEGGAVCPACAADANARPIEATILAWVKTLIGTRFDSLLALEPVRCEQVLGSDLLDLVRSWLAHYPGIRSRALDFILGAAAW